MDVRTDEGELKLLTDLLTERYGLVFEGIRLDHLRSRLVPRLGELHLDSFLEYYHYLSFHPRRDEEHELLRARITNNETYFFRETHQFDVLVKQVIPELALRVHTEDRPLRLLSAACSSGEEPYSLVIALQNGGVAMKGLAWRVDACDLNPVRIERARRAVYERHSLRACDGETKRRYFQRQEGERYELRERHREGVHLFEANLVQPGVDRDWPVYDAIFCRNMLIYLSEAAMHQVIDLFARVLAPHGTLFLGHSESLIGKRDDIRPVNVDGSIVYRKV